MSLLPAFTRRKTASLPEPEMLELASALRQATDDLRALDTTTIPAANLVNRVPAPRYESDVETSFVMPEQTFMHAVNLAGAPVAVHHQTSNRDRREDGYRWVCTGCGLFGAERRWMNKVHAPAMSLALTIQGANDHAGECRFPVQNIAAEEV